jgi:AraC-like DNA-binding protein
VTSPNAKMPLARFGLVEIHDQEVAFEHCRRTFPEVRDFVFLTKKAPRLLSAGVNLGDVRISTAGSTGHRISLADDKHVTVLIPFRRTISVSSGRRTVTACPGGAILTDTGSRDTELAENYRGGVIKIPRDSIMRGSCKTSKGSRLSVLPDLSAEEHKSKELASLRRYSLYLFKELEQSEFLLSNGRARANSAKLLAELAAMVFFDFTDTLESGKRYCAASMRQVQLAEQLMQARLSEAVSIPEIAESLDISVRALQIAFRRHRQTSPKQFMDKLRLEEVRRRLRGATPSDNVTGVVFECGIAHLGRFAANYRRQFHETPLDTLRRARRGW